MRIKILAVALAAALAAPVAVSAAPTYTLDLNLASVHLERWARHDLNQRNLGAGLTAHFSPNWSVSAGWYRNSYRRGSTYLLASWTPLHWSLPAGWSVAAGATAGLDSGYRSDELATQPWVAAALLRVIAPQGWSINLTAVPNAPHARSGFIGMQLAVPL
ncbi:MAG: hypothetical protein ACYCST_17795 [Acidimicrobiales bacterium]